MRSRDVGLLGLGALCAVALSMGAGGCQPEGNSSLPTGPGGPGGTTGQGGSGAGVSAGEAGSGGEAGAGSAGEGGEGGGTGDLPAAKVVTIEEITTEVVPRNTVVELKGVVAMSQKFFIDDTNSGDCLWGVFLSSPGLEETAANSGILAVSRSKATTDGNGEPVCPSLESASAGDPFPDDVAPGDVLDVVGKTTYFSSSSCRDACGDLTCDSAGDPPENANNCRQDCGTSPELIPQSAIGQFQLEWIESVVRTDKVEVPEPHVLTADEVVKLSSPTETPFHHKWGGVKVRLEGSLSPVLRTDAMGMQTVIGSYGSLHLENGVEGGLVQVGNKIYYIGGAQSACHKAPVYSDVNVVFNRVDGFIYKNFCIWSLQLANKCTDIDPPSNDCVDDALMCR
ncbi:hypothetical protein WMF04_14015 [Sorangium sp. So ce260]|uniref:hypothetical protein n=1 Tax=Sorangium sp. So ce260 TaxID=3133291 RepID=UPI003F620FFD